MEHTLQSFQVARDYLVKIPAEERGQVCKAALRKIKKEFWEEFPPETWNAFVRLMDTITCNLPGTERRIARKPPRKRK